MRLRRYLVVGAVAAAVVGALSITPASATNPSSAKPADQSLRALGMRNGLFMGTAVNMDILNSVDEPKYTEIVKNEFSTVTAENVMKWEVLEPTRGTYDWSKADAFIDFARKNGQLVRGHVLVWHSQLPKWLTDGVADKSISQDELRGLLKKHITDVVTHFKGKIWQWDVVNEAVYDSWALPAGTPINDLKGFWGQNLGEGYIADAFRWARAADPKALLFYNDYNIEAFGDGGPGDKTSYVYNMVKKLRDQHVPIDGVGSQGHLATQYGNYNALQVAEALDKFAGLGVATALTEVDARSLMNADAKAGKSEEINPRVQASAYNYSVLLQGCLASRHCLSYTVWSLTDKYSWVPGAFANEDLASIYDKNYNPVHAYYQLKSDLAFAGAPLVLPRIPQCPKR
jgi:endo-1,4-beta-xylanase